MYKKDTSVFTSIFRKSHPGTGRTKTLAFILVAASQFRRLVSLTAYMFQFPFCFVFLLRPPITLLLCIYSTFEGYRGSKIHLFPRYFFQLSVSKHPPTSWRCLPIRSLLHRSNIYTASLLCNSLFLTLRFFVFGVLFWPLDNPLVSDVYRDRY